MTIPTQAQIEAALRKLRSCLTVNSNQNICNFQHGEVTALIAALTAAAEARKHDEIATTSFAINRSLSDASLRALSLGSKAIMQRMADLEALTAAAEAGEPKIDPSWKIDQSVKAVRNATIERCAQVADSFRYGGYEQIADTIAAAIRALKEEL